MPTYSFVVAVVQNILAVFEHDLQNPFNRWSDQAYAQGFSWRESSVCFQVPEEGDLPVTVNVQAEFVSRTDAIRAILVPFSTRGSAGVEISGIYELESRIIPLAEGHYSLYFECGNLTGESRTVEAPMWCTLTFVPGAPAGPAILKQDAELHPPATLVLDGRPA